MKCTSKKCRCVIFGVVFLVVAVFSAIEFLPMGFAKNLIEQAESLGQPPALEPVAPRPISLYFVGREQIKGSRAYPGVATSSNEVDLAFRVAGPLIAVNVGPGSVVEKGQALMQIDPRDFEDNIAVLEAQLIGAKAAYEDARLDFERIQPLRQKSVVSQSDYDKAKSLFDSAASTVKNVEAQLRIARHRLEDTSLRAPFDGIVTAQLLENHEMVQAGQKALKLHDISQVEIHVNIPENELCHYNLHNEHQVQVTFPAVPAQSYPARLSEWSAEADPLTRTYEVTFTLPAPKGVNILPGMTAEVYWQTSEGGNAPLSIPASAVASNKEGDSIVWVYDAATCEASPRVIKTGELLNGSHLNVLQGLKEGEVIVAAGVDFVTPGMKLRPLEGGGD